MISMVTKTNNNSSGVQHYLGNPLLKAARQPIQFTVEQAKEFAKCRKDPIYFASNYAKVVSLDNGVVLFKPYPYQKRLIRALHKERKVAAKLARQMGKSVTCAVFIAWYVLFNDYKTSAILANKAAIAREIFSRVAFVIENLPFWLQQGVVTWNKTSFELENGSKCFCAASSPSSVRGTSINLLMCTAGETKVTVRDDLNTTKEMTMVELESFIRKGDSTENVHLRVLTDTGWSPFSSMKVGTGKFLKIGFSDGRSIRVTEDHKFKTYEFEKLTLDGWISAKDLKIGSKVHAHTPPALRRIHALEVSSIDDGGEGTTYDLVGVEGNSRYYTNGILSHNCDEFAHLDAKLADEFIASVFPTLSSSKESKLIIVSTPKGMNQFHKIWVDGEKGLNGFVTIDGKWQEHPGRDQAWADAELAVLGKVRFAQEVLCAFSGSSKTLFDGAKVSQLTFNEPSFERDGLKMFEAPIKGHMYICAVDVSRGQHLDHSAFIVYDVTKMPYNIVATFKSNTVSTMVYPSLIEKTCRQYNDAYALIEINDAGGEVANTLFYDFEYPNVYWTHKDDLVEGAGYPGVRTTKKVKSVGCSVLKELVEQDQLMVNSYDIIVEMNNFVAKGASYAAEDTQINDDLMSCMWLFAWLTKQPLFAEVTNMNIREVLSKKFEEQIRESMVPFGYITDGTEDDEVSADLSNYSGMGGDPFKNWLLS